MVTEAGLPYMHELQSCFTNNGNELVFGYMPTISGNCVSFTLNACKQIRYLQDRHPTYRTRFMMQEKLQFDLYKIEQNKVQKKKKQKQI
jgi:hypothetical protein